LSAKKGLTDKQLDGLKELGNVGTSHAATALSQVLNQKIMISIPKIIPFPFKNLGGGSQAVIAGVMVPVLGDLAAKMVLLLPRHTTIKLASIMTDKPTTERQTLTDMEYSAIKELGNILGGAYSNAITEFTGLLLMQSVPELILDLAEVVLAEIARDFKTDNKLICIISEFFDLDKSINGYVLFIPDQASLEVILRSLKL